MTEAQLQQIVNKAVRESFRGPRARPQGETAGEALAKAAGVGDFLAGKVNSLKVEFDEVRRKTVTSDMFALASMVDASLDLPTATSRIRDVFDQFPPLAGAVSLRYTGSTGEGSGRACC